MIQYSLHILVSHAIHSILFCPFGPSGTCHLQLHVDVAAETGGGGGQVERGRGGMELERERGRERESERERERERVRKREREHMTRPRCKLGEDAGPGQGLSPSSRS